MRREKRKIKENKILTKEQILFLEKFKNSELNGIFRLSGGTALSAFYLYHRYSYDLDFFSREKIPFYNISKFIDGLKIFEEINYRKVYDRNIFLLRSQNNKILNVEFVSYPLENIKEPLKVDGLYIDNFLDILINKLCAIADRNEIKDYVDVFFSLKNFKVSLKKVFTLAEEKCGIKGISEILKYKLLEIPRGFKELYLIKETNENEIKRYFQGNIKKIIKSELKEN